jgi:hypothetical protein
MEHHTASINQEESLHLKELDSCSFSKLHVECFELFGFPVCLRAGRAAVFAEPASARPDSHT